MPSTITTYYTFSAGTKARSSQVNTNFSNYRGDLLPVNEATVSASDMTHYLGGADHRWLGAYLGHVNFTTSTTTAGLILRGDTAATTGAWLFQINSVTVAQVNAQGFNGTYLQSGTVGNLALTNTVRVITAITFTANSTHTIASGINTIHFLLCGGGGGGGRGFNITSSGGPGGGGSGGGGAAVVSGFLTVNSGDVLSIVVGLGGNGTTSTAAGTGGASYIIVNGVTSPINASGGYPGGNGASSTGGVAYDSWTTLHRSWMAMGGDGGAATSGTAGYDSQFGYIGGAGGAATAAAAGGGGGGGAALGNGGAGGNGRQTVDGLPGSMGTGYGSGGGGGGGVSGGFNISGGVGAPGNPGIVVITYVPNS